MKAALCSPYKYLQAVLISVQEVGSMIYNILQSVRCWSTWLRGIFNCVWTVNEYAKSVWIKAKVVSGCLVAKLRRIPPVPCPHLTHAAPVCIRNSDLRSESVLCVHFEHSEHCVGLRYSFRDKSREVSRQVLSFLEMKTLARVEYHDICKLLNQVCHVMISNE